MTAHRHDADPQTTTSFEANESFRVPKWKVAVAALAALAVAACSAPSPSNAGGEAPSPSVQETSEPLNPQAEAMEQMKEATGESLIDCQLTGVAVGNEKIDFGGRKSPYIIANFDAAYTDKATTGYFSDNGQDGVEISWFPPFMTADFTYESGRLAGQSRRVPAIDPRTIRDGHASGLRGAQPEISKTTEPEASTVLIPLFTDPQVGKRSFSPEVGLHFLSVGGESVSKSTESTIYASCGTIEVDVQNGQAVILSAHDKNDIKVPIG